MTLAEAKNLLDEIRAATKRGDHEQAHLSSDFFLSEVARTVANDVASPHTALARLALQAHDAGFERWCA